MQDLQKVASQASDNTFATLKAIITDLIRGLPQEPTLPILANHPSQSMALSTLNVLSLSIDKK